MSAEEYSALDSCTSSSAVRQFVRNCALMNHIGPVTRNADNDDKLPRHKRYSLAIPTAIFDYGM